MAECTGANVFFIKDGAIHTPDPDCFLDGITRRTVIGLAKARGIEVIERAIMPEELGSFTECFITGTAAEVTPVSEIAEHRYKPACDNRNADQRLHGAGHADEAGGGGVTTSAKLLTRRLAHGFRMTGSLCALEIHRAEACVMRLWSIKAC